MLPELPKLNISYLSERHDQQRIEVLKEYDKFTEYVVFKLAEFSFNGCINGYPYSELPTKQRKYTISSILDPRNKNFQSFFEGIIQKTNDFGTFMDWLNTSYFNSPDYRTSAEKKHCDDLMDHVNRFAQQKLNKTLSDYRNLPNHHILDFETKFNEAEKKLTWSLWIDESRPLNATRLETPAPSFFDTLFNKKNEPQLASCDLQKLVNEKKEYKKTAERCFYSNLTLFTDNLSNKFVIKTLEGLQERLKDKYIKQPGLNNPYSSIINFDVKDRDSMCVIQNLVPTVLTPFKEWLNTLMYNRGLNSNYEYFVPFFEAIANTTNQKINHLMLKFISKPENQMLKFQTTRDAQDLILKLWIERNFEDEVETKISTSTIQDELLTKLEVGGL